MKRLAYALARNKILRTGSVAIATLLFVCGCCCGERVVLPASPYRSLAISPEVSAPMYLVNYDKDGGCESPLTFAQVVQQAQSGTYTDVFLMSHGWNNDWPAATRLYNDFFDGFIRTRPPGVANFKPMFVGVIWPSTLLVTASERGPRYEFGAATSADEMLNDQGTAVALRDLAGQLAGDNPAYAMCMEQTLRDLVRRAGSDRKAAEELAKLLAGVCEEDENGTDGVSAAGLLEAAREAERTDTQNRSTTHPSIPSGQAGGDRGRGNTPPATGAASQPGDGAGRAVVAPGTPGTGSAGTAPRAADAGPRPEAAPLAAAEAGAALPDPRWIVRVASVLMMKDRAAVVGGRGVSELVAKLAQRNDVRVHLIGHSYGAKVVLEATLVAGQKHALREKGVDSMLLLQPAVSAYSFATQPPGANRPGKYKPVLDRVKQPVFATFSAQDWPLTQIYQHFVVRDSDRFETGAFPETTVSRFAALGGFGPRPLDLGGSDRGEFQWRPINDIRPGGSPATKPSRVYGLGSTKGEIPSHGGVSNEHTWRILWTQVVAQP